MNHPAFAQTGSFGKFKSSLTPFYLGRLVVYMSALNALS